ncbi:hypothetical protein [Actinoplanes sp. ATCC 53533]|uniref:hypothetical protein n=1 Tax=Actinoplanes sp. ATCC 53533 TaxID=1288362 RepID=UPI00131503DF|nr:hypothetical protein [Actinoplanes sp. ATCC 53533]
MGGDELLDGLGPFAGDAFDVGGGSVVAVRVVQLRHGLDVLLGVRGQARLGARLAERPADEDPWTALRAAFQSLEEIGMTPEARLEFITLLFGNESCAPGTPRSKPAGKSCSHR